MKTMKMMLAFVAGALMLSACNNEEPSINGGAKLVTLTAYQEGEATDAPAAAGIRRVAIDGSDSQQIDWTAGDKINYFGGAAGESMTLTSGAGTKTGTFEGTVTTGTTDYVLYPYQSTATNNAGVITAEVPMTQYAVANSFDPAAALMVGVVNAGSVQFKNVMSYVKVTIPEGMSCKQVVLKAKDAWTTVAGKVNITASTGAWAETTAKEGQAFVRLVPSGSATTLTAGASYYIAILPQTMATGFELIFNDNDVIKVKQSVEKEGVSSVAFSRNTTKKLGAISSFTYTVGTMTVGSITMADRNIGAAQTTAYGDYFAWGALRPAYTEKTTPTWYWSTGFVIGNAPYNNGASSYTKYSLSGNSVLEASDDIAAMLWGGKWRMETLDEWTNNKTSFGSVPNGGRYDGTTPSAAGSTAYCWLSKLNANTKGTVFKLTSTSATTQGANRYQGCTVRPVRAQ